MKIPVQTSDNEPQPVRIRYLRVGDRCDRCGAQAFVLVVVSCTGLLFCAHHFACHEEKLRQVASLIYDDRHWINRSASPT